MKKKYKADETRELQMVIIEDKPSAEDEAQVKAELTQLLNGKVEYVKETQKMIPFKDLELLEIQLNL